MKALDLLFVGDKAKVMGKDYEYVCPYCLAPDTPEWPSVHCGSCHETFADDDLWTLHRHKGGCRFPGNLERFYEEEYFPDLKIWFQKPDPNAKDEDGSNP